MTKLTTIQVDKETSEKLAVVASQNRRSKSAQLATLVDEAYREILTASIVARIETITSLPHPPDGIPVPLVTVQKAPQP